jgi:hypothetical protein
MRINSTDIPTIFAQYLDTAYMPKANGWQKFGAGAAAFIMQHRMPQIMEQYGSVMRMAGVLGGCFGSTDYKCTNSSRKRRRILG